MNEFKMKVRKNICFLGLIIILVSSCLSKNKEQSNLIKHDSFNQTELMKQWLGNWKIQLSKDTFVIAEGRPFGNKGLEGEYKVITKDNVIKEVKMLYGYDTTIDKIIEAGLIKEGAIEIFALWFVSDREYMRVAYADIAYPEKAKSYMIGEMKSNDTIVETWFENEKPVYTHTWFRIEDE